jgi:hypothetical protein
MIITLPHPPMICMFKLSFGLQAQVGFFDLVIIK